MLIQGCTGNTGGPSEPALFQDGRHLAYISDPGGSFHYDISVKRLDAPVPLVHLHATTSPGLQISDLTITADTRRIYYLEGPLDPNTLWEIYAAPGSTPRRIAGETLFTHPLQWKPWR